MPLSHANLTVPDVKKAAALIKSKITETWPGAARQTSKQTLHDLKPNKENHALTHSNV